MEFLIIIIIIGVIVYFYNKNSEESTTNDLVNSKEFQDALEEAKNIRKVFLEATKISGGTVIIVKNDIDNLEKIDWERDKFNYLIYFRVQLEYGYSLYLDWLKNDLNHNGEPLTESERNSFIENYLQNIYGKSKSEIEQLGLDPRDIVYDTVRGEDDCESILYYRIVCPCGLKGDSRDVFINELKK